MSIRFQADADLKFAMVKAVREQEPAIDFASAIDSELEGVEDPEVLERAAITNRVLISHDRLSVGKSSPGLLMRLKMLLLDSLWNQLSFSGRCRTRLNCVMQVYHLPSLARHVFRR